VNDVELPAGPAIRFHRRFWPKQTWYPIAHQWEEVTYAVRPPQITSAIVLTVSWVEFKLSEALINAADAIAQPWRSKLTMSDSPPGIPPGVPRDYAVTVPDSWALIPLIPPPPTGPVPVEAMTAEAKKRDRSAHIIRAPAGTAIRAQTSATDLSLYFPVPGSGAWLLLAFSGPDGPLSPVMTELFDAIAATLRWAG
jgi:hypothetical protein